MEIVRLSRTKFVDVVSDLSAKVPPGRLAREIMRRFGGRRVPAAPRNLERDDRIRAALDRGETPAAIAAREGMSRTNVVRIGKQAD